MQLIYFDLNSILLQIEDYIMAKITFKGNQINTKGELPKIGEKAPDFTLVRQDLSEVSLEGFKNKKKILNIVPSLDTGVCASSAKKFHDKLADYKDAIVVNISMDLPFAQGRFCKAEGLTQVETLSSFRSSFPDDYGVRITDGPLKGLCSRAVVVIDENNKVIYTEQVPEITQEPNYDKVLEEL